MVLGHVPWLLLLQTLPRAAWLLRQRVLGPQILDLLSLGTWNQGFGEKQCTGCKNPLKQDAQGSCIPKASEGFFWCQTHIPMEQSVPIFQMCLLPSHLSLKTILSDSSLLRGLCISTLHFLARSICKPQETVLKHIHEMMALLWLNVLGLG